MGTEHEVGGDHPSRAQGTLWVVVGATGTGKTSLSLDLAETLPAMRMRNAEIVNADAMQFYRGMDIGTAKVRPEEQRGIPHHLFDVLNVTEEATVAWYQPTARNIITEILNRGNDAILVGGSGLYVSSVIYDFAFPPRDETLRNELEQRFEAGGVQPLIDELRHLAPSVAETVDVRNPRRVIRALEVATLGGDAQVVLPEAPKLWHDRTNIIGVACPRDVLVPRLDQRVMDMWEAGLIDEVRRLIPEGIEEGPTASRAIGYAQAISQLRGTATKDEAIAETQVLTRRYARRQVSWFKRYREIEWLDAPKVSLIHQLAVAQDGTR